MSGKGWKGYVDVAANGEVISELLCWRVWEPAQEAQLMLTTYATRLGVGRGQQTWYHFGSVATFR